MTQGVTPIVALDVESRDQAFKVVEVLGDLCSFYKVGSQLYTAEGPSLVRALHDRGASIFLDLKFHDIPNTVRGAVKAAAALGVRMLTVHASGGVDMIEAAVAASNEIGDDVAIMAVSVLTSLDAKGLSVALGHPVSDVSAEVLRLARVAADAGAHGVVCGGQEVAKVREVFGARLALLVPGVRLAGDDRQDQSRVVTPRDALLAGARYIVLGRTVTAAPSPRNAMNAVLSDLS